MTLPTTPPAHPSGPALRPSPEPPADRAEPLADWFSIDEIETFPPFLVSLVSDDDHWLFAASNGGLTAGRISPDTALFPYYTQDKLIDLAPTTGPLMRVAWGKGEGRGLWSPFEQGVRSRPRTLRKRLDGTQLTFEETLPEQRLRYAYTWGFSRRFGFVRRVCLSNLGPETRELEILDGLQNLMPCGITDDFQNEFSILVDAYKRTEAEPESSLRLVYLSSIPTDRAEPAESLRATTVWSCGLGPALRLVTTRQLEAFHEGRSIEPESGSRGLRAAALDVAKISLQPGESRTWYFVAEVAQSTARVARLNDFLARHDEADLAGMLEAELAETSRALRAKVASADGLQLTAERKRTARHFSNVMFNIMRGGVFLENGRIAREPFLVHLRHFNRDLAKRCADWAGTLPEVMDREQLEEAVAALADPELERLASEYLPLTFSRRHGDPSRPWNHFAIQVRDEKGRPRFAYQGNWRDIFQNWETLMHAFPNFVEGAIFRFLNATTAEGYNPYRLTHDGFEWETIDPDEPWSNIGYWGDHQIIYLLRLLEASRRFHPERLDALLGKRVFAFARVPYRIRSYEEIVRDPRSTVVYDVAAADEIAERVAAIGADGKLLADASGRIHQVSLLEKLLVPILAKLANFVPGGGIWMNTQRPEWNDANNALVGYGISVVTMAYCHRYVGYLLEWLQGRPREESHELSSEVAQWLQGQAAVFAGAAPADSIDPSWRRSILDTLGTGSSRYRGQLYAEGLDGTRGTVTIAELCRFLAGAKAWLSRSLRQNERADGLYHSYNLLHFESDGGVAVEHLYEMLEGQVAMLSANLLRPREVLRVVDALRASPLYRADQGSYVLYPDRDLPAFLEKNLLDPGFCAASQLVQALGDDPDQTLLEADAAGRWRFAGTLRNAGDLRAALRALPGKWQTLVESEGESLVAHFEEIFAHRAFTGRSGTFFAYEGLGSIYWHMVSKLVLAIQENVLACAEDPAEAETSRALARHFQETLEGLGMNKEPRHYGAFPTDAYSHTPRHAGAQQPGMTGQVKEDILVRWGELGVCVREGRLEFRPRLLREDEFLKEPGLFRYPDVQGREQSILVPADAIAFTFCQVPVIYRVGARPRVILTMADGEPIKAEGTRLPADLSRAIFHRRGEVLAVQVEVPKEWLVEAFF